MSVTRDKYLVLNFAFLTCLMVLFLNDHFLKFKLANALTGKLSDAAGIIILPLLIAYLFPTEKKRTIIVVSALLFVFWKSPFSQGFIDRYNEYALIPTSRVVDDSDLYVLLLLPIPYGIMRRIDRLPGFKVTQINPLLVIIPTVIALIATSPPPSYYYTRSKGNLTCYKCDVTVSHNQDVIVAKLKSWGIVFDSIAPVDSLVLRRVPGLKKENARVYRLNQLIIEKDTLRNLDFTMRTIQEGKTRIYFNGMQVRQNLSDGKLAGKLRRYYKEILFRELKGRLNG
ncbi:MAG TPA: hypothetical protein VKQ08_08910 [Cyclobacteriaceae bacterium]|nr:hypothetical protein [Cyclobacteriaceae bacterium]